MNLNTWRKKAFTLIEIIVVISLLAVFTLSITNIDFSRLSTQEKHKIFTNKVISNIETIRNYAFSGKWVWINTETPNQWKIDISSSNSGSILTSYSWDVNGIYYTGTFWSDPSHEIINILCTNIDRSITESITGSNTGSIVFQWNVASIEWCSDSTLRILEFQTKYLSHTSTIQFNSINSIIEVD